MSNAFGHGFDSRHLHYNIQGSGRVVDYTGLQNQQRKLTQVRILRPLFSRNGGIGRHANLRNWCFVRVSSTLTSSTVAIVQRLVPQIVDLMMRVRFPLVTPERQLSQQSTRLKLQVSEVQSLPFPRSCQASGWFFSRRTSCVDVTFDELLDIIK